MDWITITVKNTHAKKKIIEKVAAGQFLLVIIEARASMLVPEAVDA